MNNGLPVRDALKCRGGAWGVRAQLSGLASWPSTGLFSHSDLPDRRFMGHSPLLRRCLGDMRPERVAKGFIRAGFGYSPCVSPVR